MHDLDAGIAIANDQGEVRLHRSRRTRTHKSQFDVHPMILDLDASAGRRSAFNVIELKSEPARFLSRVMADRHADVKLVEVKVVGTSWANHKPHNDGRQHGKPDQPAEPILCTRTQILLGPEGLADLFKEGRGDLNGVHVAFD